MKDSSICHKLEVTESEAYVSKNGDGGHMALVWTEVEASHLLGRVGFGYTKQELEAAVALGREATVDRLLLGKSLTDKVIELPPIEKVMSDGKPLVADRINDQQTYWLYRLTVTQAPLIEKMTLFWHGHFATSYQKVNKIPLMVKQIDLFRKMALGNFQELVIEVGKDPAMMLYLDSNSNRKGKPNENYAREVMELFTLGIGNYSENDIKEAAKAFTGWTVNYTTGEVKFVPNQHDKSIKNVLGQSKNFNETSIVDVLFDQKALPLFMANKLLQFFATSNPTSEWVAQVAADFEQGPTVGDVLRKLFLSDAFYEPGVRGGLIKAPVEYVAGIVKVLELPMSGGFSQAMRKMGQELYLPPDVAGWRGGTTWLMSTNLLARYQFAESVAKRVKSTQLTGAMFTPKKSDDPIAWVRLWAERIGIIPLGSRSLQAMGLYADDTFIHTVQKNTGMRGLLQLLLISPEAQMK